jgi:hypothetical protein
VPVTFGARAGASFFRLGVSGCWYPLRLRLPVAADDQNGPRPHTVPVHISGYL